MRAIHLVGPNLTAGVLPLCGDWGSMDSDWTTFEAQVTCGACAADMRSSVRGGARTGATPPIPGVAPGGAR
jgi:hypothetical protein